MNARMFANFVERFESGFFAEPNTGCWLWVAAAVKGPRRYGSFGGGTQKAHRVSYELFVGPISNGLWVLYRAITGLR